MSSGLSKARLGRMHQTMAAYVESGEVPGVVTLVSRRGEVHIDTIGAKGIGGDEIGRDTIFRIASMTKPITAVAAMILVEECKLRLDEPIDRLLPELSNRRVLRRLDGPLDDTVPARRSITVRDLLCFLPGFGCIVGPGDPPPLAKAIFDAKIDPFTLGPISKLVRARDLHRLVPDEWLKRLGALPLAHQPGERWIYHTAYDALGVLIARASGRSFEVFLRERIFAPLGMKDTGFSVEPAKIGRLATCYSLDPATLQLELYDDASASNWARPPIFTSGGGGLVSTIEDYHAFALMILNGGRLGAERILSRPTIEAMTADQLTAAQKEQALFVPGFFSNLGMGLGVSVVTRRASVSASPGQFGWDGAFGTSWRSDPREDLVAILMIQRMGLGPAEPAGINPDFLTSVYQAIDD
ncbi:MAG: serine hydrolase domain-containing protein [Mycobacteriales bacterium]